MLSVLFCVYIMYANLDTFIMYTNFICICECMWGIRICVGRVWRTFVLIFFVFVYVLLRTYNGCYMYKYSKTCPQRTLSTTETCHQRTFCEEHKFFHGFCMELNLYTTETVYNERTLFARTNFCPDEPVYNELSLNFFLFTSKKPSLGSSKQYF
jgi:hypothetical protein